MRKKKGFTLIELVIVVAVFGILIAIAVPAWTTYLQRAKVRTQNAKAKAIFNAAQTAVTDLDFQERKYKEIANGVINDPYDEKTIKFAKEQLYTPVDNNATWYYYWDGKEGYLADSKGDKLRADEKIVKEWNASLGRSIKKIVDDEMVYKFAVKDYKVLAVVCAAKSRDLYIGGHPKTMFQLEDEKMDIKKIRKNFVKGIDVELFDLYPDAAPKGDDDET